MPKPLLKTGRGFFHAVGKDCAAGRRCLMSYVLGLKCKECGHRTAVAPAHVCGACFGPYEVEYDYAAMAGKVTRESIGAGPRSLWRYKDLLPVEGEPKTGHHSGFTPLKRAA